jgi:hypothetical protein
LDGFVRKDRLVAPVRLAYTHEMGSNQQVTAQGVRDLNHRGPKKRPEPSSAEASAATPVTVDDAPSAPEPIAANDHTADGSGVDNG